MSLFGKTLRGVLVDVWVLVGVRVDVGE